MKTREWVVKLLLLVIPILFLGGCKMFENKPTLTKEQQRNVVRWIARGYNINKVQFLRFEKNNFTGSYSLLFRVNNKNNTNIVEVENLKEFDCSTGEIGLDPIEKFLDLEKRPATDKNAAVDISRIKIVYLGGNDGKNKQ
ncbi:hypothetical protein C1I62_04705 [Streptococcus intermedius]|uniref:hypothetical protein n=1 Tax=Streptococcus intermedius TaxID=1338 RepID=UPI000C8269E6|nr:hypothetical protein [Streptococcus intermedius]PMR66426.1 hypothetical protein C1I62_04705 [Streptococcus intermedius]